MPACCREFDDPVDNKLLLESLLNKPFPFLKDLFIVFLSAAAALLLLPSSTAPKKPSKPRFSPHPSESSHFHRPSFFLPSEHPRS